MAATADKRKETQGIQKTRYDDKMMDDEPYCTYLRLIQESFTVVYVSFNRHTKYRTNPYAFYRRAFDIHSFLSMKQCVITT